MLLRRISDLIRQVRHKGGARYTGFLNDRERDLARMALGREKWPDYSFFGGYQGAEREMLCVFEDNGDVGFPLQMLKIEVAHQQKPITHRDYLGALLGLGLERDCVGDILVEEWGSFVFLSSTAAQLAATALDSIGRSAAKVVSPQEGEPFLPEAGAGEQLRGSVASLRLDAVLSLMGKMARSKAAALVEKDAVQVNHVAVSGSHYLLRAGDVLSVRGMGKFALDEIAGESKKGRIIIQYRKY